MTTTSNRTDHRVIDSPLGELLLISTPTGIARLAFDDEDWDQEIASWEKRPRATPAAATSDHDLGDTDDLLGSAGDQLGEYFEGGRKRFTVPLDLSGVGGFTRRTLEHLMTTEFGSVTSYGKVAASVGSPGAARAVGSACSHNPVPILVPCHRVLTSAGRVGGYLGGLARKEFLLDLERGGPMGGAPAS